MKPAIFFGTRPELIKIAPIVHEMQSRGMEFDLLPVSQHQDLLTDMMKMFNLPATDLRCDFGPYTNDGMRLTDMTQTMMRELDGYWSNNDCCVIVQGDTSTAFNAALGAYYHDRPIVHVEAGLRTGNKTPWPEEAHRRMISAMATLNCAPTQDAYTKLLSERVPGRVVDTGNTVIDAVLWMSEKVTDDIIASGFRDKYAKFSESWDHKVLITGHRRENIYSGHLLGYAKALQEVAEQKPNVCFLWPVHPNPEVANIVNKSGLRGMDNVILTGPAPYDEFVWLMTQSTIIVTDSGGIVEEAPSLMKPVIIMREDTERQEAVDAGCALLVGTPHRLVAELLVSLDSDTFLDWWKHVENPFGDGTAATHIVDLIGDLCE